MMKYENDELERQERRNASMSPVSRTEGAISTLIERINNRGNKLFK